VTEPFYFNTASDPNKRERFLHRLATVLHHANCSPPPHCREDFYKLKQAICEKFGVREHDDLQRIVDKCWGYRYTECGPDCEKCGGSGIYSQVIVRLERWRLAYRVFHKPIGRVSAPIEPITIEGRIRHTHKKLGFACWRVLTLLWQPQFYLYLDQFKMDQKHLRRFKRVLAYLLEFDQRKWHVESIRFADIEAASVSMRGQLEVPF
jgi:hypothetical protein